MVRHRPKHQPSKGLPRAQDIVFVSWTPGARASAVARDIGAEVVVPAPWAQTWPWPARYLAQAAVTTAYITARRPRGVLFTNPPFLTGFILLMMRRKLKYSLWADCHSGAFNDLRWSRFKRFNASMLGRCDGVVFHNTEQANEFGSLCRQHIVVWSWRIRDHQSTSTGTSQHADAAPKRPTVLVPLSYAFDEPVSELLTAAARCPDLTFILTGSAPEALEQDVPDNVRLTGWVSDDEYGHLLATSDAVICLTTRAATMQTTVIEAVEYGKPSVISDTAVLREWRGTDRTAFFVSSHAPDELSAAIRAAARARPDGTTERLREAIIARSAEHISRLHEAVNER